MAVAASGKHFKVVKNEENKIHPLKSPRKSRLKPPFESTLKPFKPPFKPLFKPPFKRCSPSRRRKPHEDALGD